MSYEYLRKSSPEFQVAILEIVKSNLHIGEIIPIISAGITYVEELVTTSKEMNQSDN